MKLILAFSFITSLSAYEITQIPGIEGISYVKQIEFDYNSTTYVATRSGGADGYDRLYKLDNNNTITLTQDFYLIWKILINKNNDVYIFSSESQPDHGQYCVHLLRSDSNEAIFLFKFFFDQTFNYPPFFIDSDDYIFFNTESGVAFLRPGQNIPMAITNLENWRFDKHMDLSGNIFLANSKISKNSLAVVTEKDKNVISGQLASLDGTIDNFKYWTNDSVVICEYFNNKTSVQASSRVVLSQYNVNYTFYEGTSERFIFLGSDATIPKSYHIYFLTKDGEVVKIEENLKSSITRANGIYATDKNGNAFIAYTETENDTEYQVLLLRADEVKLRRIKIPATEETTSLMVDESDNLWILAGELFVVLKNTEEAVLVSGNMLTESQPLQLKMKKGTGEIFISAYKGVFVCTNN